VNISVCDEIIAELICFEESQLINDDMDQLGVEAA